MSNAKTSAKGTKGEALPKIEVKETQSTTQQQETPKDESLEIQAAIVEAEEWKAKAEKLLKENDAIKAEKDKAEETALQLAKAKAEAEKNAKKPITVAEAIEKGKLLNTLASKLNAMTAKRQEIKAFNFGGGQHSNEALTLNNADGGIFSTTNTGILEDVKSLILARIDRAIAETEEQIIQIG